MLLVFAGMTGALFAQYGINYFRPYDQNGINVFEAPKYNTSGFEGLKVRIGGSFTQQFQSLKHENAATPNIVDGKNLNELYSLGPGFNLATANLVLDVQLDDGIRLTVESYMSSRHHQEFWVKGGYIQIDKLPMLGNPDWFADNLRVKIGHFQVNYGDQQFRRTDNGNAMYNPFVGNYIMDAFATEIGGEVYLFATPNIVGMIGMTSGIINGDVSDSEKAPSVYGKISYDNQITSDLRFRLSGSIYHNGNSARNTLYSGDRAGSRFYMAMAPAFVVPRGSTVPVATTAADQFTTGRVSPDFTNEVTSIQFNPFLKYKGLEFFGTLEMASGNNSRESSSRDVTQVGAELLYRFAPREQLYVGGRYNSLSGEFLGQDDASVSRVEVAAGWHTTKNILLKIAYVDQKYKDFASSNLYHLGQFNGLMIEAIVGF